MKSTPRVFFAILNMGLGHTTRSMPLMKKFIELGWDVIMASSGRSLQYLKKELPENSFVELTDYNLHYTKKGLSMLEFTKKLPHLLKTTIQEHLFVEKFVKVHNIDYVFSDQRYGCFSSKIPSYFISHQLRFIAPKSVQHLEFMGAFFNKSFYRRYTGVIVPDVLYHDEGLISGKLSGIEDLSKIHFPGILSSISCDNNMEKDIDLFVSVSGPEPQRSILERIIRAQIRTVPGKKVIALGIPESDYIENPQPDVTIYHHLGRSYTSEIMNRSRIIVSRSGYTTIMELAELGKKALFIPTPGQTEQIYLAERLKENGWFYYVNQQDLNLKRDINIAHKYPGFTNGFSTSKAVNNVLKLLGKNC